METANELFAHRDEAALYVEHAQQMLQVADHNLADGFYASAINRAYYAIFYAANALLATKGLSRSKHSAVIATFRQYFVKPGLIEDKYSDIYGRVMDADTKPITRSLRAPWIQLVPKLISKTPSVSWKGSNAI
ncbi:MAG TPA: HEPN domain-containing protein [Anaerolineae bacterium]|nr:HEPN domain-containing protein [Anaerolineae bacterium]